jgi:hypothetical protein
MTQLLSRYAIITARMALSRPRSMFWREIRTSHNLGFALRQNDEVFPKFNIPTRSRLSAILTYLMYIYRETEKFV